MIEIISEKGERYSYDPATNRIFRDGYLLSSTEAEPMYSNSPYPDTPPNFSGVYFRGRNEILSLSGRYNPIVDTNTII